MSFHYITKAGNLAFPTKFLWAGWFWNGTACVHSDSFGWGFVDTQGKLKVRAPDFQSEPTGFFEGLALIRRGKLYGFMDWNGKICIEPQYRSAESFDDGVAPVRASNSYTFIDTKGKIVMSERFSDLNGFSEGLALAKRGSRFYYLNRDFKSVLGPFQRAFDFKDGIARVRFDDSECFIDRNGKIIFENEWEYLESGSSEGRICFAENGRCGFVDTRGKVVIPAQYDEAHDFNEGIAIVTLNCDTYAINLQGERLFTTRFDSCLGFFSEGLLGFERGGKWGYMDSSGECVIREQFDVADIFRNGLAPVAMD